MPRVRRCTSEEAVDASFWGSQERRRFPFSGSILVDLSILVIAALVVSMIVGLALLWPHGTLPRSASVGPIRTRGAVAQCVERRPCTISASHVCRLVRVELLDGPERGRTTLLTRTRSPTSTAVERCYGSPSASSCSCSQPAVSTDFVPRSVSARASSS
jgi:hypothetical protein